MANETMAKATLRGPARIEELRAELTRWMEALRVCSLKDCPEKYCVLARETRALLQRGR